MAKLCLKHLFFDLFCQRKKLVKIMCILLAL